MAPDRGKYHFGATRHTKSCPHTTIGIKKIKYQSNVKQPHSKTSYLSTCGHRYIYGLLKLGSVSNFLLAYQCLDLFLIHYLINLSVSLCHSQVHISHKLPGTVYENERAFFLGHVFIVITSENNFLRDVLGVVFQNLLSSWSSPGRMKK